MSTRRKPRDVTLTCPSCGFEAGPTTDTLAARSIRIHSCAKTARTAGRAERVTTRKAADGPRRDCTHKQARHRHGTAAAFALDRCRCRPCRDARAAYNAARARAIAYGTWNPYTDATPVRAHLLALADAGIGHKRAAALAGVAPSTVSSLRFGKAGRTVARVRLDTARRILAVAVPAVPTTPVRADGALVDATGTHRRLRALACVGWSDSRLAERIGLTGANYLAMFKRPQVRASTARAVAALYDELWDVPPPAANRWQAGGVRRTLRRAKAAGWSPPLAWDDDTIDDPAALPAPTDDVRDRTARRDDLVEDVTDLVSAGVVAEAACARLGLSRDALQQNLRRAGRPDLWRALTGSNVQESA